MLCTYWIFCYFIQSTPFTVLVQFFSQFWILQSDILLDVMMKHIAITVLTFWSKFFLLCSRFIDLVFCVANLRTAANICSKGHTKAVGLCSKWPDLLFFVFLGTMRKWPASWESYLLAMPEMIGHQGHIFF